MEIAFDEWNLRQWKHEKFIEWQTLSYGFNPYNRELKASNSELTGMEHDISRHKMDQFIEKMRKLDDKDNVITAADAVYTACVLNAVMRMCKSVTLGGFSPAVNGKGLFSVCNDKIVLRPTFHVFNLYSNFSGNTVLDVLVKSNTYKVFLDSSVYNTVRYYNIPYIDASATMDEKRGRMFIAVANRNKNEYEECAFTLEGFDINEIRAHEVVSDCKEGFNDIKTPDRVTVKENKLKIPDGNLEYHFPPHSVTILEVSF